MNNTAYQTLAETKNDCLRLRAKAISCPPKNKLKFEALITQRWNQLQPILKDNPSLKNKFDYQILKKLIYGTNPLEDQTK
jgi:hypothetical protein